MTHPLIETNTLDACIVICAPNTHTAWHGHMPNTTHNMGCQARAEGGGGQGNRNALWWKVAYGTCCS